MRARSLPTLLVIVRLAFHPFFADAANGKDKCLHCTMMVETFLVGMRKTENQHFAGGNTDWEERKLGRFSSSETRLVEIMEYICKLKHLDKTTKFSGVRNIEFKCQQLAEEYEESLESWYFHRQNSDPNLLIWLCFEKLKLCCPEGHYGKQCKPCPAVEKKLRPCFGRGVCDGDGSREGSGKCQCEKGYVGIMCSNCDSNYFLAKETSESIECKECHQACTGGCSMEGPRGCRECRSGWTRDEKEGCIDINECLEEGRCPGEHKTCVNTEGSFVCDCVSGYKLQSDGSCALNVHAAPEKPWIRPDTLLRSVSICGFCFLLAAVAWRRSVALTIFAVVSVLVAIYIEYWIDHSIVPQQ